MIVLGIDPGASGALAFFNPDNGSLVLTDMPSVVVKRGSRQKTEINPQMLAAIVRGVRVERAVLERVGAMPGQGVSSMFAFGRSVGMVEGVLAALQIPVDYVTPQQWQRACGVRDGKDGSRARAAEIFPAYAGWFQRVRDSGRSDAALMAWWAVTR